MNASPVISDTKTMADFRPFQSWRYNPGKVDLQEVIAPPYDIISPMEQRQLHELSPYNCVRLILNQETSSDDELNNRYTRARDFFQSWRCNEVLMREPKPAYYLYRQIFKDPYDGDVKKRFALFGVLKLESYEKGIVVRHEKTLSKPREDRKKLLEATHTNFSPVFGLYEDTPKKLAAIYQGVASKPPLFEVQDGAGVRHEVWVLDDANLNQKIHQILSEKKIYIADGHHRYQTALDHGRARRLAENIPEGTEIPSDFVLMALVEFHDPGLVIYPTHRMITSFESASKVAFERQSADEITRVLNDDFEVEKADKNSLIGKLGGKAADRIAFGLRIKGGAYILTLKDWKRSRNKMPAGKPDIWYQVDVNILGHLVFASLFGMPENKWEGILQYTHSNEDAMAAAETGRAQAVFLLRAPKVEVLRDMGKAQELLPQKSTYFYPKLASGLVFYHHDS